MTLEGKNRKRSKIQSKKCLICENDGKYKCPKCSTYNCSVKCFKAHKENGKCEVLNLPPTNIIEDKKPSRINLFTTVDTVPAEKLDQLACSKKLKEMLKNSHLKSFLTEINSAPNSWNAMRLAMMEPIFLEFADECLNIVEPQEQTPV